MGSRVPEAEEAPIEEMPTIEISPRPGLAARALFLLILLVGSGTTYAVGWPGLLVVGIAPVTWLVAVLLRPRRMRLFDGGVEISTYWEPSHRMPFEDVRSVYRHPERPWLPYTLVLVDEAQCRLPIPNVDPAVEPLLTAVERACVRPVHTEASQAFREGARLYFGPIVVHRDGFELRGRDIPWGAVRSVEAAGQVLRVEGHTGRIASLPVEQIPFPTVLVQLLRELDLDVQLCGPLFLLEQADDVAS